MELFTIWKILGIVAFILLIVYFKKKNSVWGGLMIGFIIGTIIAVIFLVKGNGFDWRIIGKGAVLGTFIGFGADLLGKVSDKLKNK